MYYREAKCAILVYDVSVRDSFQHVLRWVEVCTNGLSSFFRLNVFLSFSPADVLPLSSNFAF